MFYQRDELSLWHRFACLLACTFNNMFANLRDKFNERLKNLTVSQDPHEKRINDLVDRATSDVLIGPDWALNMELVDVINSNPSVNLEKATRALKRSLQSHNTKVQLLTITAIETCIKNCTRQFHKYFSSSELFVEMLKIADPPPQMHVSSEVKDRILCLVEDLAKALEGPYRRAYEALLDNGVDFPVRNPEETAPLEIPPETAEPAQDISEEDRAAIAQAMAELAAEARHASPTAAAATGPRSPRSPVPAAMMGVVPVAAPPGYVVPPPAAAPAAVAPPAHAAAAPPQLPPHTPQDVIAQAKDISGLLKEILGSLPPGDTQAINEAFVTEVADQCRSVELQLQDVVHTSTDEAILADALATHETLEQALAQYNSLKGPAEGTQPPSLAALAAAAAPVASAAPTDPFAPASTAVPQSTLPATDAHFILDEEEDDDADAGLVTRRNQAPEDLLPTIAPPPQPHRNITDAPDLIDLGSEHGSPEKKPAPAEPSTPPSNLL